MLRAETLHPAELAATDAAAWGALCAASPQFANPLLGPDFAQAVGRVRDDARVSLWRWDDRLVGVLAHHRRPGGFARPIGAPISDYHALVATDRLDVGQALALAGINAYRFNGLVDPRGAFEGGVAAGREAFLIELDGSADDYLEALRVSSPKRFKNYRRLDHKLEREVGEITVVAPDWSQAAFDQIMAWKHDQLVRTGAYNFLRPPWVRALMDDLFSRRDGAFQGLMINLYAGGKLVAGHFGVRQDGAYHPWIASVDPDFAAWSPGQVFLLRAIAAMPRLGLTSYDLGPGHEHYKRPYALTTRTIAEGLAVAPGAAGRAAQVSQAAWMLAGGARGGAVARLQRNLDAVAVLELSLAGRARGLAAAVASKALRSGSRELA
jgi:CelD/BcsL family acetyltransferase involved in cellulose biosynthesis